MSRPYPTTTKVKVVAAKEPDQYRNKNGELKECLLCACSDGAKVVKVRVYDPTKFSKFVVGNTVVMRDTIEKKDKEEVIVTKTSKVFTSAAVAVSEELEAQGWLLINPPPSPVKSLSEALLSPQKVMVSVMGKVESEEAVRTVIVKGEDVPIKTLHLSDATTTDCKVTLWRGQSNTDARPGDYITVTDVVTSTYKNETSLSATSRSTVKKGDAPSCTSSASIVAVSTGDTDYELLLEDDRVVKVSKDLVQSATDEDIEQLVLDGPLRANITFKGADVVALTFAY